MNEWTSLLNDLPFNLMTPSSIIVAISTLPRVDQLKFLCRLGKCAPSIDCVLFIKGFNIRE